ncbi:diguanylate cyclase [Actinoplanes oblitus]|uniref:Diguanylate cyclase n=1 Tax=Actinoplanes oblitus TaxID=3040509 RepID=A0ABY8WAV3_9ACTN|nr:diguanylate cyclase [Actinoplanes oblitus]WIM94627.1 diguanylate cyclase [Actinoplanes oblitus]
MNVRQKLLGGYLVVALMVAATALIAWYTDQTSARRAATIEAAQVARGIGKDIVFGLPGTVEGGSQPPLYYSPAALRQYLTRLRETQHRNVIAIDYGKYVIGDTNPANVGVVYRHDTGGEVARTIRDGRSRVFVEKSAEHPQGIKQVVVPMIGRNGDAIGAVIVEYTPLYQQMMSGARDAQTVLFSTAAIAFVVVLLVGWVLATSLTRRITKLTTAVGVIGAGDYTHRLPITTDSDEIARLALAVNAMAEQLDRSAREILAKEYTDSILANAGEGICGLDAGGRIAFANAAAGRITGLGVAGLLRRDATVLLPESLGLEPGTTEGRLQRPDGSTVRVEYTVSEIEKAGRRIGAVIVLRDVSRQRALEYDLRHQALHDALTGLPNRKLLLSRLAEAHRRARAGGAPLAVLYLDLDGFKRVNDTLGHDAGDLLLQAAAQRLTGALRAGDTVARLGGDEFAVLLDDADPATAERLAQACRDTLAQPFALHNREGRVSVSIGVVPDAARYADADEVLRNADVAMYAAKGQGKNRWLLFEDRMHEQLVCRLDQESRLRAAAHRGELLLHLQPVTGGPDGRLAGVEAMACWQDPEQGLRTPGSFRPLAEQTGTIVEIDRWVLREACQAVGQWQIEDPATAPAWVAVTLSAASLAEADLTDQVAHALTATGLAAGNLVLQLTETMVTRDLARATARLGELRELGVRIAIGVTEAARLDLLTLPGGDLAQGYHLGQPTPAAALRTRIAAPAA